VVNLSDYVVDVFDVQADRERLFDYVVHVDAEREAVLQETNPVSADYAALALQPREGALGQQYGYQYLTKLQAGACNGAWQSVWRRGEERLRLFVLPSAGTQVLTGESPTIDEKTFLPFLLIRRRAQATRFLVVMEHTASAPFSGGRRQEAEGSGQSEIRNLKSAIRIVSVQSVEGGVRIRSAQGVDTVIVLGGPPIAMVDGELAVFRERGGQTQSSVVDRTGTP
jgi:hypothetical protein